LISGLPRNSQGRSGGDGVQGLVAELAEDVVAALEQLAGEREARAVPADPLGCL
jgi:hypothetical protein